jgi:hypothetical protein
MQRESSQGSLAASIFRKEFWKSDDKKGNRNPWLYFNSDSSTEFSSSNDTPLSAGTLSRRVSSTSLQPSPISSTSRQRSYTTVSPGKIKHNLSAHPLDPSTKTLSEISFDWRD